MTIRFRKSTAVAMILASSWIVSCGKTNGARPSSDGSPPLRAEILVGTQCPLGTITKPIEGNFTLSSCKTSLSEMNLVEAPGPIYLSGDCAEKTLGVRTPDGAVDTLWQVLPDGSFSLLIGGFSARLADDGAGHPNCSSQLTMELSGRMNCENRDVFSMDIDSMRFWMSAPENSTTPAAAQNTCALPSSCHFETSLQLRQCG